MVDRHCSSLVVLAAAGLACARRQKTYDRGPRAPTEMRGAAAWAVAYGDLAQLTRPALVNGAVGVVVAPEGRLVRVLRFAIANGKITEIEVIGNPARFPEFDVSIVD